jgi:hypothetical protein
MAEGEKIKVVQRHGILGAGLWLDIDVNTVYGCVQWGLIPYIKIQSNVRFRRTEIEDFLETHSYRPKRARKQ